MSVNTLIHLAILNGFHLDYLPAPRCILRKAIDKFATEIMQCRLYVLRVGILLTLCKGVAWRVE